MVSINYVKHDLRKVIHLLLIGISIPATDTNVYEDAIMRVSMESLLTLLTNIEDQEKLR